MLAVGFQTDDRVIYVLYNGTVAECLSRLEDMENDYGMTDVITELIKMTDCSVINKKQAKNFGEYLYVQYENDGDYDQFVFDYHKDGDRLALMANLHGLQQLVSNRYIGHVVCFWYDGGSEPGYRVVKLLEYNNKTNSYRGIDCAQLNPDEEGDLPYRQYSEAKMGDIFEVTQLAEKYGEICV